VKGPDTSSYFHAFDQCGGSENGFGVISLSGYQAPNGTSGEVSFSAPEGTRLERVRLWRTAWSYGHGSGGESQRNYLQTYSDSTLTPTGDQYDGSAEVPHGAAGTTDTANHGIIPANLLDISLASTTPARFTYRVGCGFAAGCPTAASDGFAAGVKIYGAIVTVRDSTEPELTVAGSGLLAAGEHAGTETVRVDAAGDNSGIKRLAVFYDDNASPVGVVDFERNPDKCAWWRSTPCSNVTGVDIPVDTRRVPDGERRFIVRAYDAAENVRSFTAEPVVVRNGTTATPTSLSPSDRGAPNGVGASDAARLAAKFHTTRGARRVARFGAPITLRGRLLNEAGAGIGGAEIVVAARGVAGAQDQVLGVARTAANGAWRFVIRGHSASRTLLVSYRSHANDAAPTALRRLRLGVRAPVGLSVRPRVVGNGDTITFRGRLLAGPLPSGGKLIDMQVKIGRVWRTFATTRARGRRGTFRHRYRFTRSYDPITYRFRALARADSAYPYATGASRTVRVRVR
jgi:hypothetical protein